MVVLGVVGCATHREEFLFGRVQEKCDSEWPVCDQISGCLVGSTSYVAGKFPGSGKLAVQVFEPSSVTVSFYLEKVGALGTETAINWYEERCRARYRETITNRTFVGEMEQQFYVARTADLSGTGDHLITFESDVSADYLAKVDVVPKRVQ